MRKLVANARIVMVRCVLPEILLSVLSPDLYSAELECLNGTQPFTVCVRGIFISVQEEMLSQAGNPMKNFKSQDNTGRFVQCVAFERHVNNDFIVERNEIAL